MRGQRRLKFEDDLSKHVSYKVRNECIKNFTRAKDNIELRWVDLLGHNLSLAISNENDFSLNGNWKVLLKTIPSAETIAILRN